MDCRSLRLQFVLALAVLGGSSTVFAQWQAVPVYTEGLDPDKQGLAEFVDPERLVSEDGRSGFYDAAGVARFPGCSEGPQSLDTGLVPSDGSFQFFVDMGEDGKLGGNLLVYFSGGGACWDSATCVGSALTSVPTYLVTTIESASALNYASTLPAGGILAVLPDNPFADFDKIYIPYCTGDVHIGSNDETYTYELPSQLGAASVDWTIRHCGFDNLQAVLAWLKKQVELDGAGPFGDITIAGSSAGGYAALINFPVIRQAIHQALDTLGVSDAHTDYSIIVDSSNGVLTEGFLDRAFGKPKLDEDGVWGIWGGGTIHPLLQSVLATEGAKTLWRKVFATVGNAYRDTRISQSTSAYDLVQSIVLLTMKKVDQDTYDPFVAPNEAEVALTALLDWSPKARGAMITTALSVPNYRYYLEEGQGHIVLIDPPPAVSPLPTSNYYEENSARGVYYTDWLHDMLYSPRRFLGTNWRNLSCAPGCLQ